MEEREGATTLFFSPWYRKGPYFEASKRHGAKAHDIYNHMYMPSYHHDSEEEYWKLVRDVTLWDVAGERQVEITGSDAFAFTNLLTPRDLTKCKVGQCRYVVLTDESGGIINDPVLARLAENHFWLSLADSDALLWAKGVAVFSGMTVRICEPDASPLQVQGPKSKQVVQALYVTEAVYSPRLKKTIGYAWVPIEYAGLGTTLTLHTPEGERTAKVARKPFIDPNKKTPRI